MDFNHSGSADLSHYEFKTLFAWADKIGRRRYHRLTQQDFEEYRRFDHWRYIGGDYECGTTEESRRWVKENSEHLCPVCTQPFSHRGNKTIDHKLPRARYPWLSMAFDNLWVICKTCNREKSEKHWYEYERFIFEKYPDRYADVQFYRPQKLLKTLESEDKLN